MPDNKRSSRKTASSDNLPSIPKISDRLEELHLLAQHLSRAAGQMERWIKAINNLSTVLTDRKKLDDLISFLYDWKKKDDPKSGKQAGVGNSAKKSEQPQQKHHPISQDGDSLYDIINGPNFIQIVEKAMARKKRK